MKKFIILFLILNFQLVYSQYTLIPDPAFEQRLIALNIDTDNIVNGRVLTSDVADETELIVNTSTPDINDITGIEDFVSLTKLSLSEAANLNFINLQGNVNLKELTMFFASQAPVFSPPPIDLTSNTLLEKLSIYAGNNIILNLANNINLKQLIITDSFIYTLNLNSNINLDYLYIYNCTIITGINLSNNTALIYLNLGANGLQSLDLSTNVNLKYLYLGSNELQDIDLENNILLENLEVYRNNLTTLDVMANTQLRSIICSENNINYFSLNNNSNLILLYADNNNLTNLTIQNGNNSALSGSFTYNGNVINNFSVLNNPNLRCIFVDDVNYCNTNWLGKDTTSNYVSNTAECNLLNTNENIFASKFKLYPNPSGDIIHIETDINLDNIEIYNMFGQLVLETTKKDINVSQLNSGTYIAKIFTEDKMEIVKFVKN